MKALIGVPYRRASAHRLTTGQWELWKTESASPLPSLLPGLDYRSVLRLRREIILDVAGVRSDCGLDNDTPLLIAVSWLSSGTSLRRNLCKTAPASNEEACLIELTGDISGADIAGVLHLDTRVLSTSPSGTNLPLVAKQAGSILLQERTTVELDGATSFFPVEVIDFKGTVWANSDAGWRLSWNTHNLDQPFLAAVRLFVNAAHGRIVHAVSGEAPTDEAIAIQAAIYFDVARSLIFGALANEEFVDRDGEYGEGSSGRTIYTLIRVLFPEDTLTGLAATANQRPDHFSSDLQGRLRLFWS